MVHGLPQMKIRNLLNNIEGIVISLGIAILSIKIYFYENDHTNSNDYLSIPR